MKIFVCGFSGAGKSTWIKLLGSSSIPNPKCPNFQMLDLDEEICKKLNISPEELGLKINLIGEADFRKIEYNLALDLLKSNSPLIVALGGGTLNDDLLSKFLQIDSSYLIYLKVDFETCYERIKEDSNRLLSKYSKDELFSLYKEREKLYLKADLIVEQDRIKTIDGLLSLVHNLK